MQTNTSKYILFTLLILTSVTLSAQVSSKKYVTRTGDTTVVVLAGTRGLQGSNAAFLRDNKISSEYDDKHSRYRMLKDAAQETEQVSSIVEIEKDRANPTSGSLSFRIAKQNLDYLRRDQEAQRIANSSLNNKDASVNELAYLYEKFGNQPSYFINGIQVEKKMASTLSDKDILTRSHKVANTATGNPNGEVWYVVNTATFNRLNIDPNAFAESYAQNNQERVIPRTYVEQAYNERTTTILTPQPTRIQQPAVATSRPSTTAQASSDDFWSVQERERSTYMAQQQQQVVRDPAPTQQSASNPTLSAQQQELQELQRMINDLQGHRGGSSGQIATASTNTYRESAPQPQSQVQPQPKPTQQARRYQPEPEVVSFKDSPQERSRRERDLFEQQQQQQQRKEREEVIVVTNQAADEIFSDPNITKETPVRSVRRIKDRERNK